MRDAPPRPWFRWSLRTMFVVVTAAAIVYWLALVNQRSRFPEPGKSIAEVRVSLGLNPRSTAPTLVITDAESIKSMVQTPLRSARRDPQPAKYEVLGDLTVVYADGTEDTATLFLPWGRWKHDDYWISDLSLLQAKLSK